MTAETALRVGMAAGRVFRRGDHRHRVVIGKDTRLSGYMLEPALTAGFTSMGMDVFLFGPLPTTFTLLFPTSGSFSDNQHGGSLPRRCERSILIGIVGLQARQSNRPRSSSAGGARLSGNALVPLVSALCFR
ncbi:hypothetical protein [Escherichia coli]|uniref:hypothetical protein n=1 Tax=Escherichia coli TaxID=562 RepID=UPI003D802A90